MPKRPDFEPIFTESGWMVSVPPSAAAAGKRVRKFFPDEKSARRFAGTIRASHNSGVRGSLISATLAMQATEATRILAGTGLSLIEAARIALAQAGSAAALETYEARWKRAMLVGEMIWSDVYTIDMGKIPRWVGPDIMAGRCGALSKDVLTEAIIAHGTATPSSVKTKLARAMAILGDCDRGAAKRGPIDILTPAQSARLLRVCERREERWVVALLLFAGVRPTISGEIGRMDWTDVSEREIYISCDVSKTNSDRHIPITPRLARLLRGHPTGGPVIPSNWKRAWQRVRRDAGIAAMADVCRHTFASNYLAVFGEAETKQAMGHTAGSAVLFRNYRRAITKTAGEKFLGVRSRTLRT